MKKNFCVVNYNKENEKWQLIIETANLKDFLVFNSFVRCLKTGKKISKESNLLLFVFDKNNELITKIRFNNSNK